MKKKTILLTRIGEKDGQEPSVKELIEYADGLGLTICKHINIVGYGFDMDSADELINFLEEHPSLNKIVCYDITLIFRGKENFKAVKSYIKKNNIAVYAKDMYCYRNDDGSLDFNLSKIKPKKETYCFNEEAIPLF